MSDWERNYKAGRREVMRWLTGYGIRLAKVDDLGMSRDAGGWEHFAFTMHVENWRGAQTTGYAFPYRQGTAHTKQPDLVDIMSALLSDASCVLDRSFDEFCSDFGYDDDSRKAEQLYRDILANNAKLAKLFRTTDIASILRNYEPLREKAGL